MWLHASRAQTPVLKGCSLIRRPTTGAKMSALVPRLLSHFSRCPRTNAASQWRFLSSGAHVNNSASFSGQNTGTPASYQLPDAVKPFSGIVGDQNLFKEPILDSKKKNFAVFSALNNSMTIFYKPFDLTELDLSISNIMNGIMNENNLNKSYELPKQNDNVKEKLADYYKIRDPKRYTHLLWIRHHKMKKHQRIKWRKKNLARIKRKNLERNITKEKVFRAELLAQIREAENFDPQAYVENILRTIDSVPKAETTTERYERYRELVRKNRSQTNLVIQRKFDD